MNTKALISTLFVLGTTSAAFAKPVVISGHVDLGYQTNHRVVVRDQRTPVADDCNTPAALPTPRPMPAVYPGNTTIGSDSSTYVGPQPFQLASYRDNRADWRRSQWVALTAPTRIDRGREFFTIGAQAGRFSSLRLFNSAGHSFISQVAIQFANGRTQVVRIDAQLTSQAPITINLDGGARQISRIVVYGSTAHGSSYQILAK